MSSTPQYQYFIGVDIAKSSFVVTSSSDTKTHKFANNAEGFSNFYQTHQAILSVALVVLETTGKYEMALVTYLLEKNACVHRAHALQVKNFIRSWGKRAKTDKVDSKALVLYGQERWKSLELINCKIRLLKS